MPETKKTKRTSYRPAHPVSPNGGLSCLKQVEEHLDELFRQVVEGLDQSQQAEAALRFDELVSTFSELRLANLERHPEQVRALLSSLDPEKGPQPGFDRALTHLRDCCLMPEAVQRLRSQLYKVAARVASTCPELLPTVALASLSLDQRHWKLDSFLDMVICASAMETLVDPDLDGEESVTPDVSVWLAAEPSGTLRAAVGDGLAYYYAGIPGVLSYLDMHSVLFDVDRLVPYACHLVRANGRHAKKVLNALVDVRYKALLREEIKRVRGSLRWRYPAHPVEDLEMLTDRALEALEDLPVYLNPLLLAILVQSWVRYIDETC